MFSTGSMTFDYQTDIWYIEYMDQWLTTDESVVINFWDLETEVFIIIDILDCLLVDKEPQNNESSISRYLRNVDLEVMCCWIFG